MKVFSPDGKLVLTASNDKTARLWEAATGKPVGEPLRHAGDVRYAVFSPDGKLILATAIRDTTFGTYGLDNSESRLWEAATGKPVGEPMPHQVESFRKDDAVFSPDGKFVLTIVNVDNPEMRGDRAARLWDAATGKPVGEPMRDEKAVISAVFSPDGKLVLTRDDYVPRLWETATGKPVGWPMRHEKAVNSVVFSPDGRLVLTTASNDNAARLWEAATGKPVGEPMRHEKAVHLAVFSPDGRLVLTASDDKAARFWEAAAGKPMGEPMPHEKAVNRAVFSPDGKLVLFEDDDYAPQLWEVATGKPVGEPMRHEKAFNRAVFSPDGKLVLTTAHKDTAARLWEAATGKPVGEPMRHEKAVKSAVFSPDGKLVLTTADEDSAARLWDAATGKPAGEPMCHEKAVNCAVFSPDGKLVLTACADYAARLWPVPQPLEQRPEQLVTVSEGITLRRIAPDGGSEWLYPSDSPVEGQLAEPLRWFAEPVRTRAIWSGASLSVPQYIFREIQDARRRFREDEADARQILNEAYIVDPAYPLIHLALAMNEDEQAARFLRDFDLKRLPESCNYTQDLDPREALKLAAQMCSEQGDEERARLTMAKLKALNAR
jgi:WD40 repeat protein